MAGPLKDASTEGRPGPRNLASLEAVGHAMMLPRRVFSRSAKGAAVFPAVPYFNRARKHLASGLAVLSLLGALTPPSSAMDACTLPECVRVTGAHVANGTRDIIRAVDELGRRWMIVVEPNVANDGSRSGPQAVAAALKEGKAAVVRTPLNDQIYLCSGEGLEACAEIPLR